MTTNKLGNGANANEGVEHIKALPEQTTNELRPQSAPPFQENAVVVLGGHHFNVNTQELDLTFVPYEAEGRLRMALRVAGTDFFQDIDDSQLNAAKDYWERKLPSESPQVYRGEYLAACLFFKAKQDPTFADELHKIAATETALLHWIQQFSLEHPDDRYEIGVHDADATLILSTLLSLEKTADLLRFGPTCRGIVHLFWAFYHNEEQKRTWENSAKSLHQLQTLFGGSWQGYANTMIVELNRAIKQFLTKQNLFFSPQDFAQAGDYLLEELKSGPDFTTSVEAMQLAQEFVQILDIRKKHREFEEDLRILKNTLSNQFALTLAWLIGCDTRIRPSYRHYYIEAVGVLLTGKRLERHVNSATTQVTLNGLRGDHPRLRNQTLPLLLDEFILRLQNFMDVDVPAFRAYQQVHRRLLDRERKHLNLQRFKPKILDSFAQNRLLTEVYLPLIADNLAKQIGTVNDEQDTDLMGLLLLISPPGHGKNTLLEYIAKKLGLAFVKIDCLHLESHVTELDPAAAPNNIAQQELEKLNLALEMGTNVMLHLANIQCSHPEFLQKFVPLADARRKIHGFWQGKKKIYNLQGKRFYLVMTGNISTESADIFEIPVMLAERADIYSLDKIVEWS